MNPQWRGPVFVLIAIGWVGWVFALVLLQLCEGLQSGMLAQPGDPCRELQWIVIGGFLFLLVASILAFASPRRSQHENPEELMDKEGRYPDRIDENLRRR